MTGLFVIVLGGIWTAKRGKGISADADDDNKPPTENPLQNELAETSEVQEWNAKQQDV